MGTTFQFAWEVALMECIQRNFMNNSLAVAFMSLFTALGDNMVAVAVICFVYWGYDKKLGRFVSINILTSIVFNTLIKNIFLRRRPYFDNEGIKCYKAVDPNFDIYDIKGQGFSFPSGHSTSTSSLWWAVYGYFKKMKWAIIATIMCILVGVSRFALGCHYPTDVLFGIVFGILNVAVMDYLTSKVDRKTLYIVLALLNAAGFFYCKSYDYFSSYGLLVGFFMADLFEEKYVNFENTKSIVRTIIRIPFGAIIFLGISEGLKMIAPASIIDNGLLSGFIFRTFRYASATFIAVGLYPMVFKYNLFKFKENK